MNTWGPLVYAGDHNGTVVFLYDIEGTLVHAYESKGTPCIHLLHGVWIIHEEIAHYPFCFDDVNRFTRRMYW